MILKPFLIRLSAKKPPQINEKTETMLGIKISKIKVPESKSIPSPPDNSEALTYFGRYDKKVYKDQLLQKVAMTIAIKGPFLIKS